MTRRSTAVLLSIATALAAIAAPAFAADTLDVKTGTWETTVATTISGVGSPGAAPDRKTIGATPARPMTTTGKTCVSKEDLASNRILAHEERNCTIQPTVQTTTRLVATRTCNATVPPSVSTLTFDAKSPERVHGTVEMAADGRPSLHIEIDAHWLQAGCDDGGATPPPRNAP